MADETRPGGEGATPQDPQGMPQDLQAAEGAKPQEAAGGEGTVNAHKYERDMANKDRAIEELKRAAEAAVVRRADVLADMGRAFKAAVGRVEGAGPEGRLEGAALSAVSSIGRALLDGLPADEPPERPESVCPDTQRCSWCGEWEARYD